LKAYLGIKAISQEINENSILRLFREGITHIWKRATKEAKRYMVNKLAEALGKEPGALVTSDFYKHIPRFNNKQLHGLLEWAKRKFDIDTDRKALKALKRHLNIKKIIPVMFRDIPKKDILALFKKGTHYIWKRATKEAKRYMVNKLAEALGKEPGALVTSDFNKQIPRFNNKKPHALLEWAGREFSCEKPFAALKALKRYLNIKEIYPKKWERKKEDPGRVCEIIRKHMGVSVGIAELDSFLRENRINKETGIALGWEVRAGDAAAREAMIKAYYHIVTYHAKRLHGLNPDIGEDEFESEGMLALTRCVERFDPDRNISFTAYVSGRSVKGKHKRIEGAMLDLVRIRRGYRRKVGAREMQYPDIPEDSEGYMAEVTGKDLPRDISSKARDTLSENDEEMIRSILSRYLQARHKERNIAIYIAHLKGKKQYEIAREHKLSGISLIIKKCRETLKKHVAKSPPGTLAKTAPGRGSASRDPHYRTISP
ncbi:unnamed protein product, partial [marine sediment metagenome]